MRASSDGRRGGPRPGRGRKHPRRLDTFGIIGHEEKRTTEAHPPREEAEAQRGGGDVAPRCASASRGGVCLGGSFLGFLPPRVKLTVDCLQSLAVNVSVVLS